jgi:L-rhamnose isomerase
LSTEKAFDLAVKTYADYGVDVDEAMKRLSKKSTYHYSAGRATT